jgi:putative membrane protein
MGSADAVPGVSGGTIALVLGIYARLLEAIAVVLAAPGLLRSPEGRRRLALALRFLAPLGLGIVAALYAGTRLLVGPDDAPGWLRRPETAPLCFAFFAGLVLASLGEPLRRVERRTPSGWALAAAGAAVGWWVVGLPHAGRAPEPWMLIPGGALAISVMLLPGVSGSMLLLVLGQYTTVMGAIHDRDLGTLGLFAAGVLAGLACFVPALRALLARRRDATLMALTGLMAGSLRALWPWKSHYDVGDATRGPIENLAPADGAGLALAFAVLGASAVIGLRALERRIERTEKGTPPRGPVGS